MPRKEFQKPKLSLYQRCREYIVVITAVGILISFIISNVVLITGYAKDEDIKEVKKEMIERDEDIIKVVEKGLAQVSSDVEKVDDKVQKIYDHLIGNK